MLKRFFVETPIETDRPCIITGSEAHHILKVLRMGPGDRLAVMDHNGARFEGVIQSATREGVTVALERPLAPPPPSPVHIVLCQALLKSGPMDYLIQKTSELGVDLIFPIITQRAVVRLAGERASNRMRHWNEIAKSAAKQSGRSVPARIAAPSSLKEIAERWAEESALKALLWEGEDRRDLKSILTNSPRTEGFIGIVGPEGGFAREEVAMAEDAGFIPVSLGHRILRAETAAMVMTAIVQYEWGDLGIKGP
jgi:16S rRNA (uracil1498-N3)-methyltransferase